MFSYYGSKSKIVHLYPAPKHGLIIEPFAGSARYALRYFDRDVILIDKYPVIVEVWKYLQQASEKDILSLPHLEGGQKITDYNLASAEAHLLGFLAQRGVATPGKTCSAWCITNHSPSVSDDLRRIAKNLFKIRHWQIQLGDFTDSPSAKGTWFIDPPYTIGGHRYKHSSIQIDFKMLSAWVQTRKGQIIACENASADWLPFKDLVKTQGLRKPSAEVFWTNEKVEVQAELFA